jgi:hypothetical protein
MLVNENQLNLADKKARDYLAQQMEKYFFGSSVNVAAGYPPSRSRPPRVRTDPGLCDATADRNRLQSRGSRNSCFRTAASSVELQLLRCVRLQPKYGHGPARKCCRSARARWISRRSTCRQLRRQPTFRRAQQASALDYLFWLGTNRDTLWRNTSSASKGPGQAANRARAFRAAAKSK